MSTLDTVRFDLFPAPWGNEVPRGWRDLQGGRRETRGAEITATAYRILQHEESGLRVGGTPSEPEWLEVSLPRLLHETNGILLKPEEVPAAVERMRGLLADVVPATALSDLTRADLVNHFRFRPEDVIQAMRGLPHPKVRTKGREFFGTGLEWPGSKVHIRFYDKRAEQDGVPGDIMRLEFQLRGRKHLPAIWDGASFDCATLHGYYRRLVLQFEPRKLARPSDLAGFLAWLDRSGILVEEQRPLEVYLSLKSNAKYRQRLSAKVRAALVPELVLDFNRLLPAGGWPVWIDFEPLRKVIAEAG